MKCQGSYVVYIAVAVLFLVAICHAADPAKSAFGEAFDEIVVESTLTVRGKGGSSRQSRNKSLTLKTKPTSTSSTTTTTEGSTTDSSTRTKRDVAEFILNRVNRAENTFKVIDLFDRGLGSQPAVKRS